MAKTHIYIPRDAAALSVGADEVAATIANAIALRGLDAEIIRTGSRGLFWLEPLMEVEVGGVRLGYGPVTCRDCWRPIFSAAAITLWRWGKLRKSLFWQSRNA